MTKEIILGGKNKEICLVDDDDFWFLRRFKWSLKEGYAHLVLGGKTIFMHRLITMAAEGFDVDHVNRVRLDNRKINLRVCSRAENRRNIGKRLGTSSIFKGIVKSGNKYYARITVNKKGIHIGGYLTQEEAAKAYDIAAVKYHKEFACTNFPITDYLDISKVEPREWEVDVMHDGSITQFSGEARTVKCLTGEKIRVREILDHE